MSGEEEEQCGVDRNINDCGAVNENKWEPWDSFFLDGRTSSYEVHAYTRSSVRRTSRDTELNTSH